MDLSALIFVALAVAWAVYLIPKALRHHEESASSRSVEGFSERMRVLARREPVDRKTARLVVTPGRPAATATAPVGRATPIEPARVEPEKVEPAGATGSARPVAVRRAAARRAARRRLRVVLAILLAGVVVGVLAALGQVAWVALAAPGAVLVAWLVACRLMVKQERAVDAPATRLPVTPSVEEPVADDDGPHTEEFSVVLDEEPAPAPVVPTDGTPEPQPAPPAAAPASGGWDPVPTTLPTYVGKEQAARRTVRTIDLDSTGVWTSGRIAVDSAIAREADQAREASRSTERSAAERRASGD
ncbi:hypothetical protein [Nocardioides dongxiaopingii]|uniref:divisome protein SepX/GlpR n=1 Tax=Nocardioides dongxiaopingii TaxID=2576036 RepID=UPI0010C76B16|nr:hypothetical protein [Nocardioides dongxiaopingii]